MGNYIDNIVLKLKRQYSKDEFVSHLIKKQSELELELGILKSERDEVIYKLNKLLTLPNEVKSRIGQMNLYKNMKDEIKSLREKNKKLKIENSRLLQKTLIT